MSGVRIGRSARALRLSIAQVAKRHNFVQRQHGLEANTELFSEPPLDGAEQFRIYTLDDNGGSNPRGG